MRSAVGLICCAILALLPACHPERVTMIASSLAVSPHPTIWPQAHLITCDCGAYQAQAVLRAHGKMVDISQLYVSDGDRERCSTLPWNFAPIFAKFGNVHVESHYAFTDSGFVEIARHSLSRGHPLIVLIQATRGHHGLHWISLWGYDANRRVFEAYDSQYATRKGGIGNVHYSIPFVESSFPWWVRIAIEVEG